MPISYPRPCPTCGTKINNRGNFSRHKKYCGKKIDPVPCPYCESIFRKKDDMSKHVRKFHSEAAKRKANDTAELHADKLPHLSDEHQTGGAVTTRGMKREVDEEEESKQEVKMKIGATHALAVATDNLIEDLKIPKDYWMTLQIGSCEHRKEGLTGETWKVPVGDFTQRALYTQSVLAKLSNVLNSGQFITNDTGFLASILFSRPERKGGKRAGGSPGQKIWEHMAKHSRCVFEI